MMIALFTEGLRRPESGYLVRFLGVEWLFWSFTVIKNMADMAKIAFGVSFATS